MAKVAEKSVEKPKAKRKVEGTFAEAWAPEGEGEVLIGKYVGSQNAVGKRGPFKAYHIVDEDNKRWSISGASLNTVMPQIPKGTVVTVTYTGTVEMPKGDMRTYDVEIDDDVQLLDAMDDEG